MVDSYDVPTNPMDWLATVTNRIGDVSPPLTIDDTVDVIRQRFPTMMADRSHWIMAASALHQAAGSRSDLHAHHAYVSLLHALEVEGWIAPG